ncbi:hypothetical protein V8Z74_14800 [Comamonas sp. w2-DMI]|uniref:hypothetical protein n=1 Tax=Comamonas sp. w2-DMI TaxID=3126391 RepID=UPI0032E51536
MTEINIRGIEIRTLLAKAKVQSVIHSQDPDEFNGHHLEFEAFLEAQALGYQEYRTRVIEDVPGLFIGEPGLIEAWRMGWSSAAELDEIRHCSSCQTAAGDPCPYHG